MGVALAYAGLCFLADLVSGARMPYWFGWAPSETAEAFAGWLIYWMPIYAVSLLALAVSLMVGAIRRFAWGLRLFSILTATLAVRMYAAVATGGLTWEPWFVVDVSLLTMVVVFTRIGSRRLTMPVFAAVASIGCCALLLNWAADSVIGGRGDPGTSAMLTNRLVFLALVSSGCYALISGRHATERSFRPGWRFSLAMPFFVLIAAAVALSVLKRPLPAHEDAERVAPNLVIVTADALRADYCSAYGGPALTPSLERLAVDGVKFERFYSLAPWTLPSLYGLFSSKYPPGLTPAAAGEQISLWKKEASTYALVEEYWAGSGEPLSTELKGNGYETAAVVGNPLIRPDDWLLSDVDECHLAEFTSYETRGPFRALPALQRAVAYWWPDTFKRRRVDMTRVATQFAEAYIQYARHRPFMLWVHYFDPHAPYDPPSRFRTIDGAWPQFPLTEYSAMNFWDKSAWIKDMPESDRDYVKSLYRGEIEYMDEGLGRILDAIDRNDLAEDTVVLFSSDHGEEFWDHGEWEHGHSLYEDQIRVPLVVRGPKISAREIDVPVSAVDVLPTLRTWLGLPESPDARGVSIADALSRGDALPVSPVFSQSTSFFTEPLQTVIDGELKAVHGTHSGQWRLYDLGADPAERLDISKDSAGQLRHLQGLVDAWSKSFPVTFDELDIDPGTDRVDEFDEMLRSIGYVN